MLDRQRPESFRPVESRSARVHRQPHATSPGGDMDDSLSPFDLCPTDRHTWEVFWSNLLLEYEHIEIDRELAEAA